MKKKNVEREKVNQRGGTYNQAAKKVNKKKGIFFRLFFCLFFFQRMTKISERQKSHIHICTHTCTHKRAPLDIKEHDDHPFERRVVVVVVKKEEGGFARV